MPKTITILIVEDDILIAQDLKELLQEVYYEEVIRVRNYQQAVAVLAISNIDLVLLDINLNDKATGVDLANHINQHCPVPFIYITSYSDPATIERVKYTKPAGFLLKPYSKQLLLAQIEIALFNYANKYNAAAQATERETILEEEPGLVINSHLLVKHNHHFIKLPLAEILWFQSDKNYVEVKTLDRKYLIRNSLKKLLEHLPAADFVKCYKQFIINIHHAKSFSSNAVIINGQQIPISRNAQEEVFNKLKKSVVY